MIPPELFVEMFTMFPDDVTMWRDPNQHVLAFLAELEFDLFFWILLQDWLF
jgi:hypothetical protein